MKAKYYAFIFTAILGISACGSSTDDVKKSNKPPTAIAGPDFSANGNTTLTLKGKGIDPEKRPLTFKWHQIDGPKVTLNNENTANAHFVTPVLDAQTKLTFRLTVTDDKKASATDDVVVTVNAHRPLKPTFTLELDDEYYAAPESVFIVPLKINLTTPQTVITSIEWKRVDGLDLPVTIKDDKAKPRILIPSRVKKNDYIALQVTVSSEDGYTSSKVVKVIFESKHALIKDLYFNDDALGKCVKSNINNSQTKTTEDIKRLFCGSKFNIVNLMDLSFFPNLEVLNISSRALIDVNSISFSNVKKLHLKGENIQSLDFSYLRRLKELHLRNMPDVQDVKISHSNYLTRIDIRALPITEFIIPKGADNLEILMLTSTRINSIDTTELVKLKRLSLVNNTQLNDWKSGVHKHLQALKITHTNLHEISVSDFKNLMVLELSSMKHLQHLNIKENVKMTYLTISDVALDTITLENNTQLERVMISGTKVSKIDLNKNKNLSILELNNNLLEEIFVNEIPNLQYVNIENNRLSSIRFNDSFTPIEMRLSNNVDLDIHWYFMELKDLVTLTIENTKVFDIELDSAQSLEQLNLVNSDVKTLTFHDDAFTGDHACIMYFDSQLNQATINTIDSFANSRDSIKLYKQKPSGSASFSSLCPTP
ncbi:PKD domain-containing protein [Thaumasiovibrio subtropicus]|uniref:PKD domain-containing protein n=1 Tax=Thaumasiovibrio subtropicus TaxID=1891207 RepID=UPI000B3610E6|nr:hypothetical protein [Thaumasiovibrio subtropicus]